MVDIYSATAENRRGNKERKKKLQDENIMSTSAMQGGHNKESSIQTAGHMLRVWVRVSVTAIWVSNGELNVF